MDTVHGLAACVLLCTTDKERVGQDKAADGVLADELLRRQRSLLHLAWRRQHAYLLVYLYHAGGLTKSEKVAHGKRDVLYLENSALFQLHAPYTAELLMTFQHENACDKALLRVLRDILRASVKRQPARAAYLGAHPRQRQPFVIGDLLDYLDLLALKRLSRADSQLVLDIFQSKLLVYLILHDKHRRQYQSHSYKLHLNLRLFQ